MLEDKEKDNAKEISQKAKENLRRNAELRRNSSKYHSIQQQPGSHKYSSWFERHLDDITAEDLTKALESEEIRSSPGDFLILTKMLCAKKGMPHNEWEELLHEQKMRQSLRQMGISKLYVEHPRSGSHKRMNPAILTCLY